MKKSFVIQRTEESDRDPSVLLPALVEATGSASEAAGVLRSLIRMGSDASIVSWVMTLETRGPRVGGVATNAWRVHADRRSPAVDEVPADAAEASE